MKRLLSVFLLVFSLLAQTSAWAFSPTELNRAVARKATKQDRQKATAKKKQGSQTPSTKRAHERPVDPDAQITEWYGLPIISYQNFIENNAAAVTRAEHFPKLWKRAFELITEETFLSSTSFKQGLPNYQDMVKDTPYKYIYIGEHHDEPNIQEQIKLLIKTVREENPNKKILLATEFVYREHPFINPFYSGDSDKATFLEETDEYNVFELARSLKMDVLALDDLTLQNTPAGTLVQIGKQFVSLPGNEKFTIDVAYTFADDIVQLTNQILNDESALLDTITSYLLPPGDFVNYTVSPTPVFESIGIAPGNEIYANGMLNVRALGVNLSPSELENLIQWHSIFKYASHVLLASSWGVEERNRAWAARIKATELGAEEANNPYDIVIIWAGDYHVDITKSLSLPLLLSSSNAAIFSFEPLKFHADEEILKIYKTLASLGQKFSLSETGYMDPHKQIRNKTMSGQAIDFNKTYYIEDVTDEVWKQATEIIDNKLAYVIGLDDLPKLPQKTVTIFLE